MKSKAAPEMMLTVLFLSILSFTSNVALAEPSVEVVFRGGQENAGPEKYDSWFGDSDGTILYFGESNFWTAYDKYGDDPFGSLYEAGDYIIGRFNTSSETFLTGLNVGWGYESVWDVVAHSNGRIYWTTYTEKIGYVTANGTTVKYFEGPNVSIGFNELLEGPNGTVYITRYAPPYPRPPYNTKDGGIVKFTPEGDFIEEFIIRDPTLTGYITCPKSLTVDPNTGEIWFNSDQFPDEGWDFKHHTFRLAPNGTLLEVITDREIMFLSFDDAGRRWFAELISGKWQMRITWPNGTEQTILMENTPSPWDFIQDIKHTRDTTLALAWKAGVYRFDLQPDGTYSLTKIPIQFLQDDHMGYTAILADNGNIYITAAERFDPPDDDIVVVKIPGPPLIYDIAITAITLPRTMVASGCTAKIYVTAENQGNFTETFNATVHYDNKTVQTQIITLYPGASTILTFDWNTTGVPPGNYTVKAEASVLPNEIDTADNTYVNGILYVIQARFTLLTLYTLSLYINGTFVCGNNLTVRLHSYSGIYEGEVNVWNGTTPRHLLLSTNVSHPLNWPIENATLLLTDNFGTILQTMTSFLVHRSDLMGRLGELDYLWTVPGSDRSTIMKEYVAIDGQWPYAPT